MSEILNTGIKLWSIKDDYDELKKENKLYMEELAVSNEKLESQQRTIEQIIDNQRELEKLLGL